jgi:hypothetical protein
MSAWQGPALFAIGVFPVVFMAAVEVALRVLGRPPQNSIVSSRMLPRVAGLVLLVAAITVAVVHVGDPVLFWLMLAGFAVTHLWTFVSRFRAVRARRSGTTARELE